MFLGDSRIRSMFHWFRDLSGMINTNATHLEYPVGDNYRVESQKYNIKMVGLDETQYICGHECTCA